MRRPRNPATMVHSLSCTDADWERVRERADAAGLSISRYLVERGLTVALPRDGDGKVRPPPWLVLEEAEQREMLDRIARIFGGCRPAPPKTTGRYWRGWARRFPCWQPVVAAHPRVGQDRRRRRRTARVPQPLLRARVRPLGKAGELVPALSDPAPLFRHRAMAVQPHPEQPRHLERLRNPLLQRRDAIGERFASGRVEGIDVAGP